jgi:DNA-binding NtrC family response regulator
VRDLQGGSPLAATSEEAREILEPRELLIPGFEHRHAVKEIIIGHWLQEISWFAQRDVVDLSPAAFKAMLGYDWPGNLDELILTMERAVRHGQGDFIELGDLPLDVRRGTF